MIRGRDIQVFQYMRSVWQSASVMVVVPVLDYAEGFWSHDEGVKVFLGHKFGLMDSNNRLLDMDDIRVVNNIKNVK